jgi:hypothetical protein
VAALVPRLAHRGMFLDGVTYASIARNLAEGRGRFWAPHYTATIYPVFHEHPPLAFWLQAQWFRVLGDHWFVERAYAATAAALVAAFIIVIWRTVHGAAEARDADWLPVGLWMAAPVVSWSIVGNLLETTVAVFVVAAVAVLIATTRGSVTAAIAGGGLSGLCVVGAALSKGPVGLFPLAAGPILALLPVSSGRSLRYGVVAQWIAVLLCSALFVVLPEPRRSLWLYLDEQVVTALAGRREVSSGSLTILVALVQAVLLPMGLVAGAIVVAARPWRSPAPVERTIGIAFMLLGLCGTLPILVSPKQTGHYLMPAVPFYAISIGALVASTAGRLSHWRLGRRPAFVVRAAAAMLAVGSAVAAALPALEREPARLAELDRLAWVAPRGATAGICAATNADWGLHAWFQRRFQMSLDASHPHAHEWFLRTAGDGECAPAACRAASDVRADLVLLRCDR